jgi:hypothetical protein
MRHGNPKGISKAKEKEKGRRKKDDRSFRKHKQYR